MAVLYGNYVVHRRILAQWCTLPITTCGSLLVPMYLQGAQTDKTLTVPRDAMMLLYRTTGLDFSHRNLFTCPTRVHPCMGPRGDSVPKSILMQVSERQIPRDLDFRNVAPAGFLSDRAASDLPRTKRWGPIDMLFLEPRRAWKPPTILAAWASTRPLSGPNVPSWESRPKILDAKAPT